MSAKVWSTGLASAGWAGAAYWPARMAWTSRRSSSNSDWRAISSKLARNSDAMPRILPMNWPSLRSRTGRSLGPTTIRATAAMTRSSVPPISGSMDAP